MPYREKVIKGLEHCRKTACESCPYNATDVKNSNPICFINEMLSDALALLKEQEPVKPITIGEETKPFSFHICGACKELLCGGLAANYCHWCGKQVEK